MLKYLNANALSIDWNDPECVQPCEYVGQFYSCTIFYIHVYRMPVHNLPGRQNKQTKNITLRQRKSRGSIIGYMYNINLMWFFAYFIYFIRHMSDKASKNSKK